MLGFSTTASGVIGLTITQAIIGQSGDNWKGFPFLFAVATVAALVMWFAVNVTKGGKDAIAWADAQREKDVKS